MPVFYVLLQYVIHTRNPIFLSKKVRIFFNPLIIIYLQTHLFAREGEQTKKQKRANGATLTIWKLKNPVYH